MTSQLSLAITQARREKASTKRQGLTAEEKSDLKRVFELFDADGGGSIDGQELRLVMRALGFQVTKDEVVKMIAEIDADGSGTVDFQEFLTLIEGASTNTDAKEECCKAFSLFTNDPHITHITAEHLKRVAQMAGEDLNADRIQAMLRVAGAEDSQCVTLDQFMEVMRKTGKL